FERFLLLVAKLVSPSPPPRIMRVPQRQNKLFRDKLIVTKLGPLFVFVTASDAVLTKLVNCSYNCNDPGPAVKVLTALSLGPY
ncbi:hypothetical protein HAX54_040301, partial [Datura stramonium]|nr:hypothetical protein [Datura stramonium]